MAILTRLTLVVTSAPTLSRQADGPAGGVGKLRKPQADAAERTKQDIGHGRKPEPELVGAHRGRSVGKQVGLAFLDAVSISPRAQ
jgi:hypothetical protein